ncbi:MAG: hypothetical protein VYD07_11020, partial [Pseudomonadota bacterium]|nr:hypothetical protein [Pseudomonadota bacterium]
MSRKMRDVRWWGIRCRVSRKMRDVRRWGVGYRVACAFGARAVFEVAQEARPTVGGMSDIGCRA